jgi:hypothetical protein
MKRAAVPPEERVGGSGHKSVALLNAGYPEEKPAPLFDALSSSGGCSGANVFRRCKALTRTPHTGTGGKA